MDDDCDCDYPRIASAPFYGWYVALGPGAYLWRDGTVRSSANVKDKNGCDQMQGWFTTEAEARTAYQTWRY